MKKSILLFSLLSLTACGLKKQDFTAQVNNEDAAVETAVGSISGLSDNQAGESYLAINNSFKEKVMTEMQNLLLPQAVADDGCVRPIFAACINGIRESTYNNCSPANSKASINGYIRLTYSQANCTLSVSDKVNRTFEVTISGPRGGSATLSSANKSDYNGNVYGGGGQLTKTANGFDVEILGKNISLDYKGVELYNVSIRTLSTVHISGTLSRQSRLVNGGQIEVNHNKAKFTALFEPHNLQWQSGCCYPVSGSLSVTYSGSKTGSATVTFNGCGLAQHSDGVQEKPVVLNYCE
ncbi:MAG: hypothetical protein A4S09_08240 [Proteobacteria bacterium SG_bin7]|nr:MAG: hypothetical protein A4S09_08240 [Proteobacteria bacterium SG_bin7]